MSMLVVHDYRGREVVLTEERWAHIQERHAEVASEPATKRSATVRVAG